jgi:D-xylose transport system substrate-binding protein
MLGQEVNNGAESTPVRDPRAAVPIVRRSIVRSAQRRALVAGTVITLALGAAACGSSSGGGSSAGGSGNGGGSKGGSCKIGLLLPETKTTRYETQDRPLFEAKVKQLDSSCVVDYVNAQQDQNTQISQVRSAITKGDKVIVLDAVNGDADAGVVNQAKRAGIPVVAYDRLAAGPISYYVSFDNVKVGQLQGQALVDAMKKNGDQPGSKIVMINGSPDDPNAAQFKKGAHSVIDNSGFTVAKEYDTQGWVPTTANQEMSSALTAVGASNVKGVYVANDGMAAGVVSALQHANVNPLPPVTGQDAQLDGIQRVIAGQQAVTIYKAIKPEAEKAAEVAVALAKGQSVQGDTNVKNASGNSVPSTLLEPVAVTASNIKDTVVKDGFWKITQICTSQFASACAKAGLS